jgi:hypothetical protein
MNRAVAVGLSHDERIEVSRLLGTERDQDWIWTPVSGALSNPFSDKTHHVGLLLSAPPLVQNPSFDRKNEQIKQSDFLI